MTNGNGSFLKSRRNGEEDVHQFLTLHPPTVLCVTASLIFSMGFHVHSDSGGTSCICAFIFIQPEMMTPFHFVVC